MDQQLGLTYIGGPGLASQKSALGDGEGGEESGVAQIGLDVNITSSSFISQEQS